MKNIGVVLLLFFLVTGCQGIQKTDKPEDLISEDKMADVLTEIALLHGARSYNKQLMQEKGIDLDKFIFEKYGIDSLQFIQSNQYYSENYKKYQGIYSNVKERLEALKIEYDSLRVQEERRTDSLRALDKKEKDSLRPKKLSKLRDSLTLRRIRTRDSIIGPVSIKGKDTVIQ